MLAHVGGVLPTLAGRLATVGTLPWVPNPQAIGAEDVSTAPAGSYYDTALAATASSVQPLLITATTLRLVFGSDYPPATAT